MKPTGTFGYRRGFLCLVQTSTMHNHPVRLVTYYPFYQAPETDIQWLVGRQAWTMGHDYAIYSVQVNDPSVRYSRQFRLQNGGSTKPLDVIREPTLCPRVRSGVTTRSLDGRWEKYLLRKGWVTA